jgi:hypothetical protein
MPKYISAKSLERIEKSIPVSYHATETCGYLIKSGAEFLELSDDDMLKWKKWLKPCKRCHEETFSKVTEIFPKKEMVAIWHCSDGRDFSSEVEALRHEIDIFRKG